MAQAPNPFDEIITALNLFSIGTEIATAAKALPDDKVVPPFEIGRTREELVEGAAVLLRAIHDLDKAGA